MAKFHGLGGIRRGSVGNETYYIHKGQNIVKRKNEYYHNPRSVKQQLNRAKMKGCSCLVKMIPLEFLKNTFADKKIIESEYNCFFRHNISTTAPMIKEESDIPNIPGCSINVQISHGTIPTLNSAVLNTGHDNILDLKGGIVLPLNTNVTTVAQVSNVLLQFYPQLKNTIVPLSQKYSFEKLKELENDYKSMLDKLSIVLPVDAYYLRGKNDVKSLLNLLSDYLKEVEFTGIEKEDVLRNLISNMQSSLTTKAIDEYADGIKKELIVLLSKTDRYNRKIGKKTIDDIVSTMLTEDEKREINTLIGSVLEQIKKDAAKTTVS